MRAEAPPVWVPVWVLADPRAGTAAQALGIAERLPVPHRVVPLEWGALARLPLPFPSLAGLTPAARAQFVPPWPRLVISAGRRAGPVARWLGARGVRTVQCMRAFGRFDLSVIGRHDRPRLEQYPIRWNHLIGFLALDSIASRARDPSKRMDRALDSIASGARDPSKRMERALAPDVLPILGAAHRVTPEALAAARAEWAGLAALPGPRVALLLGGPIRGALRGAGLEPALATALGAQVAGFAGSVMASASRRTGTAATQALAEALSTVPHRLHRWGAAGANPYLGFLAWADLVVVSGDSVSMLSEALMGAAPVFIAPLGDEGPRHLALHESLYAAGQARPLAQAPAPFARPSLDEVARVAAEIRTRGWL